MSQELAPTNAAQVPALANDRFERSALTACEEKVDTDPTKVLKRAMWVLIAIFGFGGIWATTVDIDGAVIASGRVIAEDRNRVVQHLEGGILEELLVREGDVVSKGDVLAKLDGTQIRSQLKANRLQRAVLRAQLARRRAETQELQEIQFPTDAPPSVMNAERYQETIESERQEFHALLRYQQARIAIIDTKMDAQRTNMQGTREILKAQEKQLELYELELRDFKDLLEDGLIQRTQVFATERKVAEVEANVANSKLDLEKAQNAIDNLERERNQARLAYLKEANNVVVRIQQQLNEVEARLERLEDMAAREEIRSPVDGIIFRIAQRTLGAVIRPGETIMEIFPYKDSLTIEAMIQLNDVNHIEVGQDVEVFFTGGDRADALTPIMGSLVYLSADALLTEQNPMGSYVALVTINPGEDTSKLMPGKLAELYFETEPRTFLEIILKPFTRFTQKALKE